MVGKHASRNFIAQNGGTFDRIQLKVRKFTEDKRLRSKSGRCSLV